MAEQPNTRIAVRVQAVGGKFLGDDIGGAAIAVRDAQSGELLASGSTAGTSGNLALAYSPAASLSTIATPFPNGPTVVRWVSAVDGSTRATTTSVFLVELFLDRPRLLEFEAFGPLGGLQSAHRTVAALAVSPGDDLTAAPGLVLRLQGLLVQVMSPATHSAFNSGSCTDLQLDLAASVAMMCGCPIEEGAESPWQPTDFSVSATIREVGGKVVDTVPLIFNATNTPGLFAAKWGIPANASGQTIFYEAIVTARQKSTSNVGSGVVTFFVNPPPQPTATSTNQVSPI